MAYFKRWSELFYSCLCHQYVRDGHRLNIAIYRLEGRNKWQLEVVNEQGTSVTWNQQFATEYEADEAFNAKIEHEGIAPFLINDDESNSSVPSCGLQ